MHRLYHHNTPGKVMYDRPEQDFLRILPYSFKPGEDMTMVDIIPSPPALSPKSEHGGYPTFTIHHVPRSTPLMKDSRDLGTWGPAAA